MLPGSSAPVSHTTSADDTRWLASGAAPGPTARHAASLPTRACPDTCTRAPPPCQAARGNAPRTCAGSRYRNTAASSPSPVAPAPTATPAKPAEPAGIVHEARSLELAVPATTRPPTQQPRGCPGASPEPCSCTSVPPRVGPDAGCTDSTRASGTYVNRSPSRLRTRTAAPPAPPSTSPPASDSCSATAASTSTSRFTAPRACAGLTHSTPEPLAHRLATPVTVPKLQRTPLCKPSPRSCTTDPPASEPLDGSSPVTRGTAPTAKAFSATYNEAAAEASPTASAALSPTSAAGTPSEDATSKKSNTVPRTRSWALTPRPTAAPPGACAGASHSTACASAHRAATGATAPTLQCSALESPIAAPCSSSKVPPPAGPRAGATPDTRPGELRLTDTGSSQLPTVISTSMLPGSSAPVSHTTSADDTRWLASGAAPGPTARHAASLPTRACPDTCTRAPPPCRARRHRARGQVARARRARHHAAAHPAAQRLPGRQPRALQLHLRAPARRPRRRLHRLHARLRDVREPLPVPAAHSYRCPACASV